MHEVISVAIAVVEHGGQFLVGRRAKDVPLGGLWEFPGGKMREGESPSQAAERECLEETGLEVKALECLLVNLQQYDHGHVKLHFIACRLKHASPDAAVLPAAPPYFWIARQRLRELAFPVGNRPLLEQLLAS